MVNQPTNLQAITSVCVCQSLSDMLQPIHLFRYDSLQKAMTKPDFTQMTRKELKGYIRQHPTDDDAIRELFVNRRSPNAKIYPFPYDMSQQELDEIFRNAIQKDQ